MAHRLALLVLLAGAAAARGEDRFGTAGQIGPSGAMSFNYAAGPDAGSIFVSPGLLWFPVNGIALGGEVSYGYVSSQQFAGFFQPATHQVALQPELGVAIPIGDAFALFRAWPSSSPGCLGRTWGRSISPRCKRSRRCCSFRCRTSSSASGPMW